MARTKSCRAAGVAISKHIIMIAQCELAHRCVESVVAVVVLEQRGEGGREGERDASRVVCELGGGKTRRAPATADKRMGH